MSEDAGWTAAELSADSSWRFQPNRTQIDELERATDQSFAAGYDPNGELIPDIELATWRPLLERLRIQLVDGPGLVLVQGLPVRAHEPQWSSVLVRIIGAAVGIVLPQNADGDRVGHVRDDGLATERADVRSYRTREDISFHTDGADIVALLCLSAAASGGVSVLASAAAVVGSMRQQAPDLLAALETPLAFDLFDERAGDSTQGFCLSPVVATQDGRTLVQYGRRYLELAQRHESAPALSPTARQAMDLLEATANDHRFRYDMELRSGDLQIIDNYRVLHGRSEFVDDRATGRVRHLLRLWMRTHHADPLPEGFGAAGGRSGIVGVSTSHGNTPGAWRRGSRRLGAP